MKRCLINTNARRILDLDLDLHHHTGSGGSKCELSALDSTGVLLDNLSRGTTGCRDVAKKVWHLSGSKLTTGTEELPRIL